MKLITDPRIVRENAVLRLIGWVVIFTLAGVALALGTYGYMCYSVNGRKTMDFWDAFFYSMRLFSMQFERMDHTPPPLQIARFLAPLTLMVSVIKGYIHVARTHGMAYFHSKLNRHIVICGLGRKGLCIALESKKNKIPVVIIEKDPENKLLRECEEHGVFCWIGDASEAYVLEYAKVESAKEVIILISCDETNVRIAMKVRELTAKLPSRPECFVHLENALMRENLQRAFESGTPNSTCKITIFDVYDDEARRLLSKLPIDGQGISRTSDKVVQVVIIGFGRMGRAIAMRAAKMGQFANEKKIRISVIDRYADRHKGQLLFHYPAMDNGQICELSFHHAEAQSPQTLQLIEGFASQSNTILHIFVCVDQDALGVGIGLRLQQLIGNRQNCNLCVRVKKCESLGSFLDIKPVHGLKIIPFGMVEDSCSEGAYHREMADAIAKATHEGFIGNRSKDSDRNASNDPAMRHWDDLQEDLRESSRQQYDHLPIKLRAIGCEIVKAEDPRPAVVDFSADVQWLAELEHTRWCAERWLGNWTYGKPSDKTRRINENLVPWADLTEKSKSYDIEAIENIPKRLEKAIPPMIVVRKA